MAKQRKFIRRFVPRWFSGIFFSLGIMMLLGAWWITRDTIDLLRIGVPSPGIVVEMIAKANSDGGATYAPLVEVTSREQGVFRFTSSMSSNPPSFSVGEAVEVLVDPDDQTRAVINSFGQIWFIPIILTFMGCVFATLSLVGQGLFKRFGKRRRGGTDT